MGNVTSFISQKIGIYLRGCRDFTNEEYMYMDIYAFNNQKIEKFRKYLDLRRTN